MSDLQQLPQLLLAAEQPVHVCVCNHVYLFHVTMEITVHSVEDIPRYTADTVGVCDNLVYYLVMHTHMKPDSTVDTLWVLHETR